MLFLLLVLCTLPQSHRRIPVALRCRRGVWEMSLISRFNSCYSPNKLLQRIWISRSEIHPMPILQCPRQLGRCFCGCQNSRDYGTFSLNELTEKGLNLLILPRPYATVADENSGGLYTFDLLSETRLPRGPWPNLLHI